MGDMRGMEGAVEWLRPFVASQTWDYCVVWKFGDDPSRFFEWVGCCCIGGGGCVSSVEVKVEQEERSHLGYCKDANFKHPMRTKACQALSYFPASIPLYAGNHGEVVIKAKATWNYQSTASEEFRGTQVLIPVIGGLVELFAFRHMPEDDMLGKWIISEFEDTYKSTRPVDEPSLEDLLASIPLVQLLQQPSIHLNFDGSSKSGGLSNELEVSDPYAVHFMQPGTLQHQPFGKTSASRNCKLVANSSKQQATAFSDCRKAMKSKKVNYQSKNLVVERNRRDKIKRLLYTLRALVPNISKMDRAAILEDAIEYIVKLQKEIKRLKDELKEIEEEKCEKSDEEADNSKLEALEEDRIHLTTEQSTGSTALPRSRPIERVVVQLEVKQIEERDFLIKVICHKMERGFTRLMDAIFSLGLQIVDANITTSSGKVLNILRVQANKQDLHPEKLAELLIKAIESGIQ